MRDNVRVHDVSLMQMERRRQAEQAPRTRLDVHVVVLAVVAVLITAGMLVTAGMGGR